MALANIFGYKIYPLSDVTGLIEWLDYIPVQQETAGRADSYDNDGYFTTPEVVTSTTGLTAWIDYIPVYVVTGRTKPWHVSSEGYIPYNEVGELGPWTPAALFASGEQGVWYDPSDLSTVVTGTGGLLASVGDPVSGILDKSKGITLGSELLDTFTSTGSMVVDLTGGVYTFTANTSGYDAAVTTPISVLTGEAYYYKIVVDSASTTGSVWQFRLAFENTTAAASVTGVTTQNITNSATQATYEGYFIVAADDANAYPTISLGSPRNGTLVVSEITLKKVAEGNHAYQTTTAAQPILRQSGDLYYLEFDGVDDTLITTETFGIVRGSWMIAHGSDVTGSNASTSTVGWIGTSLAATTYQRQGVRSSTGGVHQLGAAFRVDGGTAYSSGSYTFTESTPHTYIGGRDASDGNSKSYFVRFNGDTEQTYENATTYAAGVASQGPPRIGQGSLPGYPFNFYQIVLLNDAWPSAANLAELKAFLATKTGVTPA